MGIILSADIGSSSTKIAALRSDGSLLSTRRVDARTSDALQQALAQYLAETHLTADDVQCIALTGVGMSYVSGRLFGRDVVRIDEFSADASGALALSGRERGVIATLGTGTAFLYADRDGTLRHLCGTGIGGGTLSGLCSALSGARQPQQIQALASEGDLSRVDLLIRDITCDPALSPDLTASNFGKLSEDTTPADLAAGAANLVLQAIGTMTVLACRCCDTDTVILIGSMTALEQVKPNFDTFERFYGLRYVIPEHAAFATAIGAGLCALRQLEGLAGRA